MLRNDPTDGLSKKNRLFANAFCVPDINRVCVMRDQAVWCVLNFTRSPAGGSLTLRYGNYCLREWTEKRRQA